MFYGGSKGGGKSDGLLMKAWTYTSTYPRSRFLILRRTFAQASKGGALIDRSHELFDGLAHWNDQHHRWSLPNGSWIDFGHVQHEKDTDSYAGSQYEGVGWDELTQFTEAQFDRISANIRSRHGYPSWRGGTGNPGGIGHGWVKKRFVSVKGVVPGEPFTLVNDEGREVGTARYIPARLADNPALEEGDPGYRRRLEGLPNSLRRALLDGDWGVFEGQVFVQWRTDRHTVRPFLLPQKWVRWACLDWGYRRPFVCLWLARGLRLNADPPRLDDCDGEHTYVYREASATGLRDEEMAALVSRSEDAAEHVWAYLGDPGSFFQKHDRTGRKPDEVFLGQGIALEPANNARIIGKRAIDWALGGCACGVPRLRVFRTCANLARTLPDLPYDLVQVEDVDTKSEDDYYDALRYGVNSRFCPVPREMLEVA